jgi:hypothetical protein
VDLHSKRMLAGLAAFCGVGAVAQPTLQGVRLWATALHRGGAIVFQHDVAVLRQGQGFGQPLALVLRAQRLGGVRAGALPGHQGVVFVAKQDGDVVGPAIPGEPIRWW